MTADLQTVEHTAAMTTTSPLAMKPLSAAPLQKVEESLEPGGQEGIDRPTQLPVMPDAIDLIFHPPSAPANTTAEAIVDAALAYRPIAL